MSEAAYAELHCHTNFSFLDGASHPEDLADEAHRLGLAALAVTDHDGYYGVVRFSEAAREVGLPAVFGAELTLDTDAEPGRGRLNEPDPAGSHLVVLATGPVGYARLARAISNAQFAGSKGAPRFDLDGLAEAARAPVHANGNVTSTGNDTWFVLTGCRKGAVPKTLLDDGPSAARRELDRLVAAFGRDRVLVELWDRDDPLDRHRNDALVRLAVATGTGVVATNNVHYACPSDARLAAAVAAIRSRRSLDEIDGWLPAAPFAHLRSPAEQYRRFARWPGAVERTVEIAAECAFDLRHAAPNLPDHGVPDGHTEMTWLRELTMRGAAVRYPPEKPHHEQAMRQIEHELGVIETLGFPGYFLVVHQIVEFCRRRDIYCQGRGSAANSAVCYALGITSADAVELDLLFERFLSVERDGPPDIDVDIEHQRREEVIQYVYERYGRDRAAQVANVITYRARSALREAAKAVGLSPGQADAAARHVSRRAGFDASGPTGREASPATSGAPPGPGARRRAAAAGSPWSVPDLPGDPFEDLRDPETPVVPQLALDLAEELVDFPRHLGIHSGGMVLADRPLVEVCPIEWARMENRSVLQWDKEDCAAAGLVKFDLLGLGMLTMLHRGFDLIAEHTGVRLDLGTVPREEPEVYELLCAADTIGIFQVESRAQMGTLPRLQPRKFYDLVVEVALIRPGPIQGGSVHPYLRRRNKQEKVTYPHPILEPALERTLGIPLFQEQLMQIAVDAAGFTPGEADKLREAMGSKRSKRRMAAMHDRLMSGMTERGITGEVAEDIAKKLEAFSDFGFPESHSVSFASLVYASAWMKLHHPAEFTAALLNSQPMGFWSPHTIVRDARRHGVRTLGPCVQSSSTEATLEPRPADDPVGRPEPGWHADPSTHAVRLGLSSVKGLSDVLLARIEEERTRAPFTDMTDFTRRTEAPSDALEQFANAGAFDCFGLERREAIWAAGPLRDVRVDRLPGVAVGVEAPQLPGMRDMEYAIADLDSLGLSPEHHPTEFLREQLAAEGVVTSAQLRTLAHGSVVEVAGIVTHRQQPATAKGVIFVNLEDETGLVNVICVAPVWKRYRRIARTMSALRIRGILECHQGVYNVLAQRIAPCSLAPLRPPRARDFR